MKTTPQELAYWLQGFFEITDAKVLTTDQVKKIKDKVASCFEKVTKTETSGYAVKIDHSIQDTSDFYGETIYNLDGLGGKSKILDKSNYNPEYGKKFQNPSEGAPQCATDPIQIATTY